MDETFNVLAPNVGNVFAEFLLIHLLEPLPMAGFLGAQRLEGRGGIRKVFPQAMREVGIDAFVLFFQRNG